MKKNFLTISLFFFLISFSSLNAKNEKYQLTPELGSNSTYAIAGDCLELAQGYYDYLISEGESKRRANRRANTFLRACLAVK